MDTPKTSSLSLSVVVQSFPFSLAWPPLGPEERDLDGSLLTGLSAKIRKGLQFYPN
jgi:hypothetical protein